MDFNTNRMITLFQLATDRAEWLRFIEEVKAAGFKPSSDFFLNPGGDPSAMFKADCANSPKIAKARKKYGITGFGFESEEAGKNIKESTYVVGEKVKVWMGGGKKALGEVKKVAFGDGYYFVEVAGKTVSRSLHELEPFIEGKDKIAKTAKKNMSLDESIESALTETLDEVSLEENEEEFDETDDYISNRKTIIGREKGNMSVDEMVEEAMDMTDIEEDYSFTEDGAPDFGDQEDNRDTDFSMELGDRLGGQKDLNKVTEIGKGKIAIEQPDFLKNGVDGSESAFEGYSNCCNAPMYGESDLCPKCKEHCVVGDGEDDGSFGFSDENEEVERNSQMVGKPAGEGSLSPREQKIDFICTNIDSIPEGHEAYRFTEYGDGEGLIEFLTTRVNDESLDSLAFQIERAIDESGSDFKVTEIVGENYNEGEEMEEGIDIELVKEAKSTKRFSILREDVDIIVPLVESKGYKTVKIFGELVESKKQGIINILIEKAGRRATIVYNDNAQSKPWSWNGAHFNFIQEALDTIYITPEQTLKEGQRIEYNERKDKAKHVEQLLEQRKFADKTTKLSKTEAQRREERSMEILKKFMGDDLMNREFNR